MSHVAAVLLGHDTAGASGQPPIAPFMTYGLLTRIRTHIDGLPDTNRPDVFRSMAAVLAGLTGMQAALQPKWRPH